ncbi:MAG TPA: hypothetical protein VF762_23475 [Blastocatellia bacterium]|jgi:hypothetical protein
MSTKARANYATEVSRLIKDGAAILSPADINVLIDRAVEVYKRKKPGDIVVELTSDGGGDFSASDLVGFDEEISGDPMIEFPVVTSGEPEFLDRRDWQFRRTPAGLMIQVFAGIGAGEKVRFHFKGDHSITTAGSTIPASDFFAFCKLAAAEGCDDLAQHFTQTGEQTLFQGVGGAFYQTKASEYEKRAAKLRKQANEAFGAGANESGPRAASATKNWDTANSLGGDRLTHRRRFR